MMAMPVQARGSLAGSLAGSMLGTPLGTVGSLRLRRRLVAGGRGRVVSGHQVHR